MDESPSYLSTLFTKNDSKNLFKDIQANVEIKPLNVPRENIHKAVFMHKGKHHTVIIKTYSSEIDYNFDHANAIIQSTPRSIWPTCAEFLPRFHNKKDGAAICCMGEYADLHDVVAKNQLKNKQKIVQNLFTIQKLLQQNGLWFLDCKLHNFGCTNDNKVCLMDIDGVLDETTFNSDITRFPYGVTIPVFIWPTTYVTLDTQTYETYGLKSVPCLHLSTFVLFCMCAYDIIKGVCRDRAQTASALYANVQRDSADTYFANIKTNVLQHCKVFNEIDKQLYTTTESHLAMLYEDAYDANYPPRKKGKFVDLGVSGPAGRSKFVETATLTPKTNAREIRTWLKGIGQSETNINAIV